MVSSETYSHPSQAFARMFSWDVTFFKQYLFPNIWLQKHSPVWDEIYSGRASHCQSLWLFSILHSVPYEALFLTLHNPVWPLYGRLPKKTGGGGTFDDQTPCFRLICSCEHPCPCQICWDHSCALKTLERNLGKNFEQCFVTLAAILGIIHMTLRNFVNDKKRMKKYITTEMYNCVIIIVSYVHVILSVCCPSIMLVFHSKLRKY